MKRWMIAAAVGLAAAGAVGTSGTAQASSTAWRQVYQANVFGSFEQIAPISSRNVWAVGDTSTKTGNVVFQPVIRHFNGSSWQAVTIPHDAGFTSDWVSASSASNVWVGGLENRSPATSVIYRWNGARWAQVPIPRMTDLQHVIVLGPDNVWAYGDSGSVGYDLFHWNGSKWQYYLRDNVNFIPQDISASASNNVWVSGYTFSGRKQVVAAYRWNGTAWHSVSMPHPVLNDGGPNVTAVSPSNVWVGWSDTTTSHALHWDGHQWRTVSLPYYADPSDIVPDGKGGYWFGAVAILTGTRWTPEDISIRGSYGDVARIQGTTSFLLGAGVDASGSFIAKPAIFRFDL